MASRYERLMRWLSVGFFVLSLYLFARSLPMDRWIDAIQAWVANLGVLGPIAFSIIYIVATVALAPASLLTIAAGAIFGLWKATVIVSLSSTTGAAIAFLIARYLARERIERMIRGYPKIGAIDQAIGEGGWKITALLRLSPAVPFNIQNYLYGVTSIRFWPCILTSWVAMLPGTFMYVYIGYLGGAGLETAAGGAGSAGVLQWTLRIVGFIATVAVTVYITVVARRALAARAHLDSESDSGSTPQNEVDRARRPQAVGWHSVAIFALSAAVLAAAIAVFWQRDGAGASVESPLETQPAPGAAGADAR